MDFHSSFQITKPVLVVATSDECGHCANFKRNTWTSLKSKILNNNNVYLIEIAIPRMKQPPGPQYPNDLARWITWYPTILIFTANSWNTAMTYKSHSLEGVIFNGKFVNSVATPGSRIPGFPVVSITEADILQWIDDQLKQPPFTILNQFKIKGPPIILTHDGKPITSLHQVPSLSSQKEGAKKYRFKRKTF